MKDQPCPSCTGILDQIDAAVPHYEAAGKSFAVVAKTSLDRLLDVARDRNWRNMRLLSANDTTFKRDYLSEDEHGAQVPIMTVFKRETDGTIRLFWASELTYAPSDPGQDPRAIGTLETFWNMIDLGSGEVGPISNRNSTIKSTARIAATVRDSSPRKQKARRSGL